MPYNHKEILPGDKDKSIFKLVAYMNKKVPNPNNPEELIDQEYTLYSFDFPEERNNYQQAKFTANLKTYNGYKAQIKWCRDKIKKNEFKNGQIYLNLEPGRPPLGGQIVPDYSN